MENGWWLYFVSNRIEKFREIIVNTCTGKSVSRAFWLGVLWSMGSCRFFSSLLPGPKSLARSFHDGSSCNPSTITVNVLRFIDPNHIADVRVRGSLWNYWQSLWRFGHWTKWKILLIAKWRGKTELVDKERGNRSAVSKYGDRGGSGLGYGRKSRCRLYPFNQPVN